MKIESTIEKEVKDGSKRFKCSMLDALVIARVIFMRFYSYVPHFNGTRIVMVLFDGNYGKLVKEQENRLLCYKQ